MSSTFGAMADEGSLTFSDGYRTKSSELAESGFRIIRAADVGASTPSRNADYVNIGYADAVGDKVARPGDVILTTKGTVGRVDVIEDPLEPSVYSPQVCFFRTRSDGPLHNLYLRYWFASREFLQQASHLMANTDMAPYLSLRDIKSLRISLLDPVEQRAIAAVLGALDDKIAANSALVKTGDELAATLVRNHVADGNTTVLRDIAHVTMGSSPPGTSYNKSGAGLPFYQGVRDFGERTPGLRVWTDGPIRFALPGDTLLSVRAPVGRVNMAGVRCCIGRGLAALQSTTARPATLFHVMQLVDWAPFEAEGTVFGSINQRQLNEVAVPAPHKPDELEARVALLESLIASHLAENLTLAELRDTLLPALMSGQLRVKDAERQVEDAV